MTVNFAGHLYNDAGTAISGASVKLLETGTTTQEGSTVTTDSAGAWAFTEADQDRYDVEITSGSSVRRIRWDDQISLKEIDVRNNSAAGTPAATFSNITNAVANQVAVFSGANSTRADNDEIYLSFKLADSAGNLDEFARMTAVATDVTSGSEDGQIEFDVIKAGTLTKVWTITSSTGAAMSFDMNVDALTIGSGADTDVSLTFDANSADGVITWMEDEDYFKFSDDILMNSTERINFYDTAIYIYSSADGQLDLVADTEVQIAATTIDINGAVALNGAITGATDITLSGELDAATLDISGNADIDGTTNLDAVDIDGNVQLDGTLTVGVDDTGLDVKFFGATAGSFMLWDESDDALELTDSSPIKIGDGGDMTIYHDGSHSYITNATGALKLATETSGIAVTIGHATSEVTIADNLTVTGTLTLGSGAELAEAELELLDGITAGTAIASKVVTTDANIDTSGQRNLTITGELDAATLDLSSSADIAGDLVLSGGADGALQFTNAGENSIKIPDNQASALIIEEANNAYITFVTTNSSEAITVAKATTFSVAATLATGSTIGNLTLANGSITDSGGALDFGNETLTTTGAVDFGAATVDSLSVSDANITNVGDIALDSISADGTDINVAVSDNSATALTIKQGSDAYLIVDTANSSESVSIGTGISGTAITLGHSTSETTVADNLTVTGTVTVGSDGSGTDVIFYSGTSGDNVTWDASEEVLQITGTNGATSLDVLDGDVRIVDKLYFYDRGGEYMSSDGSTLAIVGNTSIAGDVTITGTTPLLTIGDNADEDTGLIFAGHDGSSNVNYHMGFDAGTNNLVIGTGSTFGSDRGISLDTSGNMVLGDQLAPVDYIHVYVRDGWTSGGSGGIAAQFAIGGDVTTHANDTNYAAHFIAGSNVGATITTGGNVTAGSSAVLATMYLTEPNISTGHTVDHSATLYIQGQATEATLDYSLWVDEGVVRMDGAVSLGTDHGSDGEQLTSGGAGAACDWTAASSLREYKNVGEQASPQAALEAMLNTPAYHFHYKEKKGTGDTNTEYVGVMADDAPWAMHYKGTIVNPVNSLGYTVLSVQALNNKIEKLERELEALRS